MAASKNFFFKEILHKGYNCFYFIFIYLLFFKSGYDCEIHVPSKDKDTKWVIANIYIVTSHVQNVLHDEYTILQIAF